MAALEIPCPKCGMLLKLPDRKLLGRKGKCSQCQHKFILEEPRPQPDATEVQFELTEKFEQAPADQTIMGTAARWVTPQAIPSQPPRMPQRVNAPAIPQPQMPQPAPVAKAPSATALAEIRESEPEEEIPSSSRTSSRRRKKSKSTKLIVAVSAAILAIAAGGFYFGTSGSGSKKVAKSKSNKASTAEAPVAEAGAKSSSARSTAVRTASRSPTHGKPINLTAIPSGARIIINLRPAAFWNKSEDDTAGQEFLACLGTQLGPWIAEMLKTNCLLEPQQIEEVLICVLAASPGVQPDVSFVVHTTEDIKKSVLLEKFNGELIDDPKPHYVGPEKAYIILDSRTFAVSPAKLAGEMVQAADDSSITADSILDLLNKTDRTRHLTVVFEPVSVQISAQFLAPDNAQPLLRNMLDWVGDEVESVAWSMHLGEEFYSELQFRSKVGSPQRLQRTLEKQLESTPRDILASVKKMNPQEVGRRQIVGRFPAMSKVYALSTRVSTGDKLVSLMTSLPERAAPNLALGAILAWDQTTRPEYGKSGSAPASGSPTQPKLPDLIADRLKMKINVDYRNEPLYQAINFVGEEINVNFKIEGNDLKMVGVTQNMKQQFKMDNAPASAVLFEILDKIGLVIIVDEQKKLITVTSAKMADEKKLEPFPLAPAKGK